ncbi:alpha/beta hydrolase family protein [Hymenobacter humi]|uniref:Alpha/beta hydrolase family protein n=1 Tax=Hymenobacter humi TaxID=1411620 RepID=A0ABW2U4L2_9BACT
MRWTTPKGYNATGVLYKPENFDPAKKYPMVVYFYEKLSDGLYKYTAPAPTPSRLDIAMFASNGYLVFTPDISYTIGAPGPSAVEFINSGVESLKKSSWVDASHIGIQGQSWGGYQVAYLITQTNMYAAAWAGAPVVNMTSAYGGIRWESGMSRQFQYEHTQSRIGATLWEKPELYIQNSPLFYLPKVQTPVVIMSNDADGAVPWYQGIEMFTDLRRLNKPVWLLQYNGEAHNLVKRENRKDISVRELQFFDHYLKGQPAPVWLSSGVPAVEKGRNWGLEVPKGNGL